MPERSVAGAQRRNGIARRCTRPVCTQLAAKPTTITGITIAACATSPTIDAPMAIDGPDDRHDHGQPKCCHPGASAKFHEPIHTHRELARSR